MKVAAMGSIVGGNTISKAENWELYGEEISLSIIALLESTLELDINLDRFQESAEKKNVMKKYLNGRMAIYNSLNGADILIADLVDFRINAIVYEFDDGNRVAFGEGIFQNLNENQLIVEISNRIGSRIKSRRMIGIDKISDYELEKYLCKYYEEINKVFKRVIFFKPRFVCNYIDDEGIKYVPNFHVQGKLNHLIERIYSVFKNISDFVPELDNMIGQTSCLSPSLFHFSSVYYEYLIEAVESIVGEGAFIVDKINRLKREKSFESLSVYYDFFSSKIYDTLSARGDDKKKKILVLARNTLFEEYYVRRGGRCDNVFTLYYDYSSDLSNIKEMLKTYFEDKNRLEYVVICPELFPSDSELSIHSILYQLGFAIHINFLTCGTTIEQNRFPVGEFEDVFNNIIKTAAEIDLRLYGSGMKIEIGKQPSNRALFSLQSFSEANVNIGASCRAMKGEVISFNGARLHIGDNCSSGRNLFISVQFLSRLYIGNDVMISFDVMIFSGDGHSIFEKKNDVYVLLKNCVNDAIFIGNHVWIGYGAKILNGSNIGDGSIVGAGAVVNKPCSNNVVLAGVPAKTVRTNIAWARGVQFTDLSYDLDVYNNYANDTKNLENDI